MDLTAVAYATLALSLLVSAVKMGGWVLNADPRAIINAGRWALALLPVLALAALAWLVASGRWTSAMLLAAFLLPVFVQAAPRWRVLFAPLNVMRSGLRPFASDLGASIVPRGSSTARELPDPQLVEQSIAVLKAYLEQTRPQMTEQPGTANRASSSRRAFREGAGERIRQRAPADVDAGGLRCAGARADPEPAGDQGRAPAPRAAGRSGTGRLALPRREDR